MKKSFFAGWREIKGIGFAAAALVVGLILILIGCSGVFSSGKGNVSAGEKAGDDYFQAVEERLACVLSEVKGAGRVSVMVTFGYGNEAGLRSADVAAFFAGNAALAESRESGEKEILHIKGVAVICDGGDNPLVKREMTEMICSLFNISSTRVYVCGR